MIFQLIDDKTFTMAKGVIMGATDIDDGYHPNDVRTSLRHPSGTSRMSASRSEPSLISCNKQPFDETDYVVPNIANKIEIGRRPSVRSTGAKSSGGFSYKTKASEAFERMNPGCTLANFFMLRVLFWDMMVSGGDVVTDVLRVPYFCCYQTNLFMF